jgi:small subunit ribosomal protein SAe
VNIPCIALCDTDNSLEYIDIAIPCNNRSTESISMVYWMLAREVLVLRGIIRKDEEWSVMVDLFYHKTPEQLKGDEEEDQE